MSSIQAICGILPILDAGVLARHKLFSPAENGRFQSGHHAILEKIARALGESSISSVQLRCKGTGKEAFHFTSAWMQALRTHSPHIIIIINDHVELALALKADGVHVGQEDTPVAVCRQILGPNKIIGLSTHSMEEVLAVHQDNQGGGGKGAAGADYIGFGPVFPTDSKPDAQPVQGLSRLKEMCSVAQMPVVAIGGIQQPQIKAIAAAGATAAAMMSGLWEKELWPQRLKQADKSWNAAVHGKATSTQ